MGWLDREDILRWIDFILADDPQAKIVIHGISMGAATTMMTAGESTPDNGESLRGGLRLYQCVGYFFQ